MLAAAAAEHHVCIRSADIETVMRIFIDRLILRLFHLNLFQRRDLAVLPAGQTREPVPKWQQNQMVLL
jgi:hypothetical protein